MKVSLKTIQELIDFQLPAVDEVVQKINAQLGGVEKIIDLGAKYKDAKIVRVVECEKHPNADRLHVCKIDAGTDELVQVVCGAPDVKKGMWAVWLPPQTIVPSTHEAKESFKLESKELRGVMSHGMLASAKELDLGDNHAGILEIHENEVLKSDDKLSAGMSFAKAFGLDDVILDIENKMFTHRPDCFGQLGVAREIAGILGHEFKNPAWYTEEPQCEESTDLPLDVFNDAGEKVPRFLAVVLQNIEIRPSPLWLQSELIRMGAKPINNIVDATNYIMLMTAQPTHAYDYDKLRGNTLGVRMAQDGESMELLNGKTYQFTTDDMVIVDGEGVIGLGGIMGGNNSEVDENTKNIVLECANFDMYTLRKSSMKHGLFTDALTRFNKGQSPLQNKYVLARLIGMIDILTRGHSKQASTVFDLHTDLPDVVTLHVSTQFVNDRLGSNLTVNEVTQLLTNVNFVVKNEGDQLSITAPFWRTDIALAEDIIEEVGRLYGYDKLPRKLPSRSGKPAQKNLQHEVKQRIRDSFLRAGANEALTYSFVHEKIFKNAEQDIAQAFQLSNALSPDLQYYRLSVLPSLLDKVHMNIKAGHDEFVLFEIGKGHNKKYHATDDDGLPKELEFVDVVYSRRKNDTSAPYYYVRHLLQQVGTDLGFEITIKPIEKPMDYPVTAPFDQTRSALVETREGIFIGMIGELKTAVVEAFKLPEHSAAMTLDLQGIVKAYALPRQTYKSLSKYPSIHQDISIKVKNTIPYQQVFDAVCQSINQEYNPSVSPVSIYQPQNDTTYKTITLHIELVSYEKTLTTKQAQEVILQVKHALEQACHAEIV